MLESGQSLSGFSIDFDRIQGEALDAMKSISVLPLKV